MPYVEKLLVFVASPGDVPTERRYVEEVISDLNRTVAADKGVVLQTVRWEKDTFPGYGQDAQALVNAQIAEMSKYALFVGILWNRLGTPTPRAASGTAEEFERAVDSLKQAGHPEIWFYFRDSAAKLDSEEKLKQRGSVLEFRKKVEANGLPRTYKTSADFREQFRTHMILWLNARQQTPPEKPLGLPNPPAGLRGTGHGRIFHFQRDRRFVFEGWSTNAKPHDFEHALKDKNFIVPVYAKTRWWVTNQTGRPARITDVYFRYAKGAGKERDSCGFSFVSADETLSAADAFADSAHFEVQVWSWSDRLDANQRITGAVVFVDQMGTEYVTETLQYGRTEAVEVAKAEEQ